MSILLTGGAGYIGSHVLLALKAQGLDAVVLDNLSTGHREFVDGGPFVQGDVRDTALLDRVFSEHSITAVVHLAGASCVQESVSFPERYYGNNVMGMLTLLTAMEKHGIRTLGGCGKNP
ncbi:NAD-dependent epimerase/dehydratase family protein [Acidithiobacillus caldus]